MTIGYNGLGIDPRMNNILSSAYDLDAPGYVCFPPNTINYYGGVNLGTNAPLRTPALTSAPDAYITQKRPNKNVLPAILGFGALAAALLLLLKKGKGGGKGQKNVMSRIKTYFANIFKSTAKKGGKPKGAGGSKGAGASKGAGSSKGASTPKNKNEIKQAANTKATTNTTIDTQKTNTQKCVEVEVIDNVATKATKTPATKFHTGDVIDVYPNEINRMANIAPAALPAQKPTLALPAGTPSPILGLPQAQEKILQKTTAGIKALPAPTEKPILALPKASQNALPKTAAEIKALPGPTEKAGTQISKKTLTGKPTSTKTKTPKIRIKKGTNPNQTYFDFMEQVPAETPKKVKRVRQIKKSNTPALQQTEFNFGEQTTANATTKNALTTPKTTKSVVTEPVKTTNATANEVPKSKVSKRTAKTDNTKLAEEKNTKKIKKQKVRQTAKKTVAETKKAGKAGKNNNNKQTEKAVKVIPANFSQTTQAPAQKINIIIYQIVINPIEKTVRTVENAGKKAVNKIKETIAKKAPTPTATASKTAKKVKTTKSKQTK